jgi:DNA-binding response OmpR family regulator
MVSIKSASVAGGTILIADDDPIFRSTVASRLMQLGGKPVEAEDGIAAWNAVLNTPIDLALIDLGMPKLRGMNLIRSMRGNPRTSHVPVVVVTSSAQESTHDEALKCGANTLLLKPLNWPVFSGYIELLLKLSSDVRRANDAIDVARSALAAERNELERLATQARGLCAIENMPSGAKNCAQELRVRIDTLVGRRNDWINDLSAVVLSKAAWRRGPGNHGLH